MSSVAPQMRQTFISASLYRDLTLTFILSVQATEEKGRWSHGRATTQTSASFALWSLPSWRQADPCRWEGPRSCAGLGPRRALSDGRIGEWSSSHAVCRCCGVKGRRCRDRRDWVTVRADLYISADVEVEAFVMEAANDPEVLAIKQTLYRTSGDSSIIAALTRAAERGKQVVVLVELTARFDEQANIEWARVLEEAGAHVVYGLVGLKTHSKTTLVVRREGTKIRRYCHVGTGNYNPKTAKMYEDLGILSARPELGGDLTDFFNSLTGLSHPPEYHDLILSPGGIKERVIELIQEEALAGPDGRIVIKINGLDDPEVIDSLYGASTAQVPIDLIVRGICCLRPGVPGLSETTRVRSIVGRFLEHSRIFRFGGGDRPARFFIGSADLRRRNLARRVEAMIPVLDDDARRQLDEALEINLADDVQAWALGPDGRWSRIPTVRGLATQQRLQELVKQRAAAGEAPRSGPRPPRAGSLPGDRDLAS